MIDGKVLGMVDDKDCLKVLIDSFYHRLPVHNTTVTKYMDKVMKEIPHTTDIVEVASIFLDSTYKRLLVMDEN
jgi:CBS domain-containing protein